MSINRPNCIESYNTALHNRIFITEYFYEDTDNCTYCQLCVLHAQSSDYGCWQYTNTDTNTFECIPNVSEIDVPDSLEWKTLNFQCKNELQIMCLKDNARIRYVRKNTAGTYDTSLPLSNLTQNVFNSIVFVELDSENTIQKSDGTLEYIGVSLNKTVFS